jgi:predicted nucleic acid-binding protein
VVNTLVFDNTVLSHFARANQLGSMEKLTKGFRCVMPAEVSRELISGIGQHPALSRVVGAPWLEIVELTGLAEIVAFARYKGEFGGGPDRNNGEAAVLAWVSVNGGSAVIDERVATRAAQRDGIPVHGSLWVVVNAIRMGIIDRPAAERLVDNLVATDMRLPTDGAGLFGWAYEIGLLP